MPPVTQVFPNFAAAAAACGTGYHDAEIADVIAYKTGIAVDVRAKPTVELAMGQALHILPGIFTTERFIAPNTILVVLCDHTYEPTDYLYEL
ncbi:MAG TPA: WxcM-like domain-containing protein [Xanthobacteraceae bacterium]|nr:WxcM-like domain-containing protein [Xanthobacteraceae bacterium]